MSTDWFSLVLPHVVNFRALYELEHVKTGSICKMPEWISLDLSFGWSKVFKFMDLMSLVAAVDYNVWIEILRYKIPEMYPVSNINTPNLLLPRFRLFINSQDKDVQKYFTQEESYELKSRLIDELFQRGCNVKKTEIQLRFDYDYLSSAVLIKFVNAILTSSGRFTLHSLYVKNIKSTLIQTLSKLMRFAPVNYLSLTSELCEENEPGSANLACILGVQVYVNKLTYVSGPLVNNGVRCLNLPMARQNSYRWMQICSTIMYSKTITEFEISSPSLGNDTYFSRALKQLNCWKWFAMAVLSPFACNKVNQLRLHCSLDPGIIAAMKSILTAHNPMKLLLADQCSMILHGDDDNEGMNMAIISGPTLFQVCDVVTMKKYQLAIPIGHSLCVPCLHLVYSQEEMDDSNPLEAIIPGFGLCFIERQDITAIVPAISSRESCGGIKELLFNPYHRVYGGMSTIVCFLNFFTKSLTVLQIDLSRIDRLLVDSSTWNTILKNFPCLRSLSLTHVTCENLHQLITAYDLDTRCIIRSLTLKDVALLDVGLALDPFFVALGDSKHYHIGRVLEELHLGPISVVEDATTNVNCDHELEKCINYMIEMLARNHVLQYLGFHVPKSIDLKSDQYEIEMGEHLSIHHQLALLSVSHLCMLPALMIQLILEFASNLRKRKVVFSS